MTCWGFKIQSENEKTGKQNLKMESENKIMNASYAILHPTSKKIEAMPFKIEALWRMMNSSAQISQVKYSKRG